MDGIHSPVVTLLTVRFLGSHSRPFLTTFGRTGMNRENDRTTCAVYKGNQETAPPLLPRSLPTAPGLPTPNPPIIPSLHCHLLRYATRVTAPYTRFPLRE